MKAIIRIMPLFLMLMACQSKVSLQDVSKINGYWEIEKVILPDGKEKDYKVNLTYDYIEINKDNKGFRKKVSPQLDGTFVVDEEQSESLEAIVENEVVYLKYKTPYATWKEELKSISAEEMVIVNETKNEYHYKKAAAINLK
ncbi:lipocalin family protein [Flavobacterium sp. '19STA2R22 D10 B1']|uniref:lipocalin family protein n=1 Tax=Flavobacterium aerium TaxID=3037261 RepID=UPI00278C6297|nr:lipocalin family protein [Flavobacterium sp. '19STA2R22 D10 B1']